MIRTYLLRAQINADRLAAALLTLAPLFYFFPAVRGQIILSPDDGVIFNVPLRVAAANIIRSGHLPLWNPYLFSGMPLHGAAQAGLLFPLNWFYLISSAPVATNLMMLSTYMLAALGAYLYARRAGASLTGAAATSLIWQFSAFMIEQVGHTNVLHTAAMLPWVLMGGRRLPRRPLAPARRDFGCTRGGADFCRPPANLRLRATAYRRIFHRAVICVEGIAFVISISARSACCRIVAGSGANLTDRRVAAQQPARRCIV